MASSEKKFGDEVSSLVSQFYDEFPYPADLLRDGPPLGFNWRWSLDNVFAFCTGALPSGIDSPSTLKILDAGCGSGVSTDYLAFLNPGAEILAIDISLGSLKVAKERLRKSRSADKVKLEFKNKSLFDLQGEGQFDYINSIGVLHHLEDPLAGLRSLASLLKPGSILHLFLYAEAGRSEIKRVQNIFHSFGLSGDRKSVKMARDFFQYLPKDNRLRKNYDERWSCECISDIHFADMYLHPIEKTFNLERLWHLIDNSSLNFAGFSNPKIWSLDRFLKGDLLNRAKLMSMKEQMQLVEYLDPDISHFEFFLVKPPVKTYKWIYDEDILASCGKINGCISGFPGPNLYDSDMNRICVNTNEIQFLEEIITSPGKSFGSFSLNWEKSRIASTARDLLQKQLLLLYPR